MELVTPGLGLIFWSTLTFVIVLFLLSKFAWKPIFTAIKERENTISEALNAAESAKHEIAQLKLDNQNLLEQAKLERDKILKDAQTAASNIVTEAREKATEESNRILENAKVAINTEKNAALAEVKNQIATLSIQIAERLIKKELDNEKSQKELVNNFVKDLKLN